MSEHEGGEPFDISSLDPVLLGGAFSAGFVLVGMSFVIGKGVQIILSSLK